MEKSKVEKSMDNTSKDVDLFAKDLATTIRKHLGVFVERKDGKLVGRFYENQPTKEPLVEPKSDGHVVVFFPNSGTKITVNSGTVYIDFWEGSVDGEGISENLSSSLSSTKYETVEVFFLKTDTNVVVTINENGKRTINGNLLIRGVPIRKISLVAADGGSFGFNLVASTNPKANFDDTTTI